MEERILETRQVFYTTERDTEHVSKPAAVTYTLNPVAPWLTPQVPEIFDIH